MGGQAFTTTTNITIPRIPTPIYNTIVPQIHTQLQNFYKTTLSAPEAPEKTSHGDIDILVISPLHEFTPDDLATALGAKHWIATKGSPTMNFAVYKEELEAFVQVDVLVCSPEGPGIAWVGFLKSFGDIWNILGSMARYYGISVNDTGMRVSIQEIAVVDRKKSMIHLTSDPAATLGFFGLDSERFLGGFETMKELFGFVAGCRFFRAKGFDKELMKARERKQLAKRPMMKMWVEEFLPQLQLDRTKNDDDEVGLTRDAVLLEALDWFKKWEEYKRKIAEWKPLIEARLRRTEAHGGIDSATCAPAPDIRQQNSSGQT